MDWVEGRLAREPSSCCPVDVYMSTMFGPKVSCFVPEPTRNTSSVAGQAHTATAVQALVQPPPTAEPVSYPINGGHGRRASWAHGSAARANDAPPPAEPPERGKASGGVGWVVERYLPRQGPCWHTREAGDRIALRQNGSSTVLIPRSNVQRFDAGS